MEGWYIEYTTEIHDIMINVVAFLFDLQRYIMSMPKGPKNSSPKFLDAHAKDLLSCLT